MNVGHALCIHYILHWRSEMMILLSRYRHWRWRKHFQISSACLRPLAWFKAVGCPHKVQHMPFHFQGVSQAPVSLCHKLVIVFVSVPNSSKNSMFTKSQPSGIQAELHTSSSPHGFNKAGFLFFLWHGFGTSLFELKYEDPVEFCFKINIAPQRCKP